MRGDPTDIPWIDVEQMIEVDRAMVQEYGIDLVRMMENAGRVLAGLARSRFLLGDPRGRKVVALAGSGGNGGGALVAARRLVGWGADVRVHLTEAGTLGPVPSRQLDILLRMGLEPGSAADLVPGSGDDEIDLILDGVIGYSLRGSPRGAAADLIRWADCHRAPILSLDVPSGVEAGSGKVFEPAVRAAATLTLALPKLGLRAPGARPHVGELYLADIGVPPSLYAREPFELPVGPLFARSEIIRIW